MIVWFLRWTGNAYFAVVESEEVQGTAADVDVVIPGNGASTWHRAYLCDHVDLRHAIEFL